MKWIIVLLVLFCLYQGHEAQEAAGNETGNNGTNVKPPKVFKPKVKNAYGCPSNNWTRYKDSDRCYYVSKEPATFKEAADNCFLMNSELMPSLTCTAEVQLSALLAEHTETGEFWLGVSKMDGDWATTRKVSTGKYRRFWGDGFPDEKSADKKCVLMSFQQNWKRGSWSNDNCDRKLRYVCIKCPNDFDYMPEIDQCIRVNTMLNNWTDAGTGCATIKYGAHLMAIENKEKQQLIEKYLTSAFQDNATDACKDQDGGKTVWIGGQAWEPFNCSSGYVWNRGRTAEASFTFAFWNGPNEKSPDCSKNSDTCAGISEKLGFKWQPKSCDTPLCSICQFY